jgi:hypothetical protein
MVTRKKTAPQTEETTEETGTVATEERQKPGRKPNPFIRLEKARARAEKARAAVEKVQKLVEAKEEAEAEEQAALQALQEAVAASGAVSE